MRLLLLAALTVVTALSAAPIPWFEPNRGQAKGPVQFVARASGYAVGFAANGSPVYALGDGTGYVRMKFAGASEVAAAAAEDARPSFTRYYQRSGESVIPQYSSLLFRDVYAGTDLRWRWHGQDLEYEFRIAPGADPCAIRMDFEGASNVEVDPKGNLVAESASGRLMYQRPKAWQQSEDGRSRPVRVSFQVNDGVASFRTGPYDASRVLFIDPAFQFATYLGGSGYDAAYAVATDAAGNVYTAGETASLDFPLTGTSPTSRKTRAAFVAKLSADGSRALYTAIMASTGNDSARAITLDSSGGVWVAGIAGSSGFPVTANALNGRSSGQPHGFAARLDTAGRLTYATYLGGSGADAAMGIAVDGAGSVYVAGYTASLDFPVTAGAPQTTYQGGFNDAFLLKLNASGTSLVYSTLLGGMGNDTASSVAVTSAGVACIAGRTDSSALPVRNALQSTYGGNTDALLACLNPEGTAWNFVTYLGGSSVDEANAIALDAAGNIYLTGDTYSPNFPVTAGAYQTKARGDYDAFAVKLDAAGSALVFSTLIGGAAADSGTTIGVDGGGQVWVAGYTGSMDFPVTDSSRFRGYFDGFLAQFRADGTGLSSSGVLGGAGDDRCYGVSVPAVGAPVIVGVTGSTDFPMTTGSLRVSAPAPYNAFVAALQVSKVPVVVSVSPSSGSGLSQIFTATIMDPAGQSLITTAYFQAGNMASGPNCLVEYYRATNGLWLLNDNGTAWLTGVTPGASKTISNGQCTLNGVGSSVSGTGTTLTLQINLTFNPNYTGSKALYVDALTGTGLTSNWQQMGTWTPAQLNATPVVVSVLPNSGSGSSQVFTATVTDPAGYSDLSIVYLEVGTMNSAPQCMVEYYASTNGLWLLNDAGTAWLTGASPGSGTVSNGQCTVTGASSSVSGSGNTLTLKVALTFTSKYTGAKSIYVNAVAKSNLSSNWQTMGTWSPTTASQTPVVVSASPTSGTGHTQTFTAALSDGAGFADIATVYFDLGNMTSGPTCIVEYYRATNSFWLLNDAGTAWLTALTPGAAGTLSNNQCTLSGALSTVSGSGNTLTVQVNLTFSPTYTGLKSFYVDAIGQSGLTSNWQLMGSWTPQ